MKYHILIFTLLLYDDVTASIGIRGSRKTAPVCGDCDPDVCEAQTCSDPNFYLCTQAGTGSDATGGCNPNADYWVDDTNLNCGECCDIRSCAVARTPVCGDCDPDVCEAQSCSDPNFFLCTRYGSDSDATGGCNPDPDYWGITDLNCQECCDIRSCAVARAPVCGDCSPDVCEAQSCSDPNFFLCTKYGSDSDATGGCNPDPDYWGITDLNCQECCDIRSCPIVARLPTEPSIPETSTPCPKQAKVTKKSKAYSGYSGY